MTPQPQPAWVETSALVTSCNFQAGALRALAFGLPTPRFRIGFEYYALGQSYTGQFNSDHAIPQGERVSLRYNPMRPGENSRSEARPEASTTRPPLLAIGLIGSAILSVAWLLVLRGCNPN